MAMKTMALDTLGSEDLGPWTSHCSFFDVGCITSHERAKILRFHKVKTQLI